MVHAPKYPRGFLFGELLFTTLPNILPGGTSPVTEDAAVKLKIE